MLAVAVVKRLVCVADFDPKQMQVIVAVLLEAVFVAFASVLSVLAFAVIQAVDLVLDSAGDNLDWFHFV